jgi:signal transduction histidine kinase
MIVIGGVRVAYDQLGFGYAPLPLGPAIAFYTIIDRCGPLLRWITVAAVAVGLGVSQAAPGHHEPYDAIYQAMFFVTAWAAGVLSRARRASVRAAESRADQAEAELDRQAARAAERERARIARELHDVVAHSLSVIVVQAGSARTVLDRDREHAVEALGAIEGTGRQTLAEMRRILGVLRKDSRGKAALAPQPTLEHLQLLLEQFQAAGLPVATVVDGTVRSLPPSIEVTAYRVVQEALTNTLKHAGPAHAEVRLGYGRQALEIEVRDNGRGAAAANGHPGYGLVGMRERIGLFDGELETGPLPDEGFRVYARIPFEPHGT